MKCTPVVVKTFVGHKQNETNTTRQNTMLDDILYYYVNYLYFARTACAKRTKQNFRYFFLLYILFKLLLHIQFPDGKNRITHTHR